jgi:ABC-type phosphate transport system auxiliary subunit
MRKSLLLLVAVFLTLAPARGAQEETLTAEGMPEFAARYQKMLEPLDAVYEDLENENLALMDESGKPMGHRPLEDRRQALTELRQTLEELPAEPRGLTLVTTLFIQSESLTDDLYDLSQVAYDNDREELAKQLSDLATNLDAERGRIESYTLSLATEKEERIKQLEVDNANLRQELKRAPKQRGSNSAPN